MCFVGGITADEEPQNDHHHHHHPDPSPWPRRGRRPRRPALLAAVTLLLFNTSQVHDMHHLITSNHVLPQFVRSLLGAGRLG